MRCCSSTVPVPGCPAAYQAMVAVVDAADVGSDVDEKASAAQSRSTVTVRAELTTPLRARRYCVVFVGLTVTVVPVAGTAIFFAVTQPVDERFCSETVP